MNAVFYRVMHRLVLPALTLGSALAQAAPFEVAISPSRFELSARSTQRLGQSITIQNVGATATELAVRTIDWSFSAEGQLAYHDELLPGSCRPWVMLERKLVRVAPQGKASFRFQIDVPADAPRGECRFMLAIEGVEPAHKALIESGAASLSLPVSGRIAVTVYVAINGAQPQLELRSLGVKNGPQGRVPVVMVENVGDAHGRLDGSLDAVDASGAKLELVPEGTPVLPGQTRSLQLMPVQANTSKPATLVYPVNANGTIDWDRGGFKVKASLP